MSAYFPISNYDKGITLSKENAERLFENAKMLFEAKKYSSASYLALQGIEEIGKALLFLEYKREKKKITKSQWEKVFKDHTKKLEKVLEAITKHCTKIRVSEGFGKSKKYLPENKVLKMMRRGLMQDKDEFAYIDYDFHRQKWLTPLKPDFIDLEGVVKAIVYGYSQRAIYALEKQMV